MPPAPSPGSEVQAPVRNIFPFSQKPNTLDRDHILVPAGWDSWGKIGVLRDGFDAKLWNEAWERDLEADGSSNEPGAKALYSSFVPDQGLKVWHVNSHDCPLTHPNLAANPTSCVQQSHPRASLPCPALRRKRQEIRPRSSRGVQEPRRNVCWYRRSSWEQQL